MSVTAFVTLFATIAHAGTPLVVEGEDREASASEVTARTGLPRSQLEPLDVAKLLEQPPQIVGEAVLRRCTQDKVGMEPARADLSRAVAAQRSGDLLAALDHLDLAVSSLGCLSELVDRSIAARIFLLRGAILASRDEIEGARSELRTALSFDPRVAWHDDLPAGGQALLEEERDGSMRHRITALPSTRVSGPWLGGEVVGSAGLEVAHGLVLVQYSSPIGVRSAWMVVSGDATLVIPGAFRTPVLARMAEPDQRREVELLLEATLPDFAAAYVHHSSWGTWLVVQEGGALETPQLVPPKPAEEPEDPERRWWRRW